MGFGIPERESCNENEDSKALKRGPSSIILDVDERERERINSQMSEKELFERIKGPEMLTMLTVAISQIGKLEIHEALGRVHRKVLLNNGE